MSKQPQPNEQVIELYQSSKKIHPKRAKGRFANWRIIAIIVTQIFFFVIPWLNWNGRQAMLWHIAERKFYIFGIVLWPQDFIFLAGLLMICAFGLFWWTTIAGRLWCGYACPQTVYTEVMTWIDHFFEGDRNKRLKLEKEPWGFHKIRIKAPKYLVIFLVCFWTGFTFLGWFTPIREALGDLIHLTLSGGAWFALAFYGFVTFLFGHIMREQVCKYMCPYARFQSAMFDRDTLVISYDEARGEPRGKKKHAEGDDAPKGDCIDCTLCVQVCPVGIDIREGLQYECIGCAACIDACDEVMDKIELPRGLIRYTTEAALEKEYPESHIVKRLWRPRVSGYGAILFGIMLALIVGLFMRPTVRVDIIKDRGVMVRENKQGWLENAYMLHIINTKDTPQYLVAEVEGFPDIAITGLPEALLLPAGQTVERPVQVATIPEYAGKGSHPIKFHFRVYDAPDVTSAAKPLETLTEKSNFIGE